MHASAESAAPRNRESRRDLADRGYTDHVRAGRSSRPTPRRRVVVRRRRRGEVASGACARQRSPVSSSRRRSLAPAAAPAKPRQFSYDVPVLAGSPWPEMRRDSRNTAESPIRGRYRGDEPWSFRTARGIFSTPVIGDDGTVYVGSADGYFYALGADGEPSVEVQDRRDHRRRRGARQAPRQARLVPDHDRLRRRDALPAARRRPAALAQAAGPLALPHRPRARRPASSSTGGRATSPTGRAATCSSATPAAAPTRSPRAASGAGSSSARTRSGPRRPSTRRATATGARSTSSPSRSTRTASCAGRRRSPATSPRRRRSAPTARSTSAPSTAACTRSTRTRGSPAGASRPPTTSTARRRWRATRRATTTAIYIGSADGSVYAVRPDGSLIWRYDTGEPVRSSPVLGRTPKRRGRDRLRRLLERQALRARRGDRRPAVVVRHDAEETPRFATATTSTARRRSASAASTSAASTAGSGSSPTTTAARRRDDRCERSPGRSSPTTSTSSSR